MGKRIDFKFVKEHADFLTVLEHYGIAQKGSGVSRTIPCPFHEEKTPSCKVNLGRKIYHCFGCDAKGNILDFVRRMENLAENDLRGAARKLASICGIPTVPPQQVAHLKAPLGRKTCPRTSVPGRRRQTQAVPRCIAAQRASYGLRRWQCAASGRGSTEQAARSRFRRALRGEARARARVPHRARA